jgi:hypothetical protein
MGKSVLDDFAIDVPCDCGKSLKVKMSRLRAGKELKCRCGLSIVVNNKLDDDLKGADKAIASFQRSLSQWR